MTAEETRRTVTFAALVLAAAAARFVLAWTAPPSVDLQSYGIVAGVLRQGQPLYESTQRYNYLPVWSWIVEGLDRTAEKTGLSFVGLTRSLLAGVDLACAAFLYRLARRVGGLKPRTAAALWLWNPVGIWVSSVQGQFDNLSVFFLLLALLAVSTRGAAPLLLLSIAVKQVTAVHPLLWLRRRADTVPVLAVYAGAAALLLPYASQWRAIRDHVLLYRAVPRSYGFSEFVLYDQRWAPAVGLVALLAACAAAWMLRFHEPARASLFVFLVLLFFAPGLGSQYFVWPLVLGALFGGVGYALTTAAALTWTLGSHFAVPGSGRFFGHLAWLSVAFWGVREGRVLWEEHKRLRSGVEG